MNYGTVSSRILLSLKDVKKVFAAGEKFAKNMKNDGLIFY